MLQTYFHVVVAIYITSYTHRSQGGTQHKMTIYKTQNTQLRQRQLNNPPYFASSRLCLFLPAWISLAPSYLKVYLSPTCIYPSFKICRGGTLCGLLPSSSTGHNRAFSVVAPCICNSLPWEVRGLSPSLSIQYLQMLKNLFATAFGFTAC